MGRSGGRKPRIAALAPEHISDLSESQIRAYTQAIMTDLEDKTGLMKRFSAV